MEKLYLQKHNSSTTRCVLVLERDSVHAGTAEDFAREDARVEEGDRLIIVDETSCYVYDVRKPQPVPVALAAPNGHVI